MTAYEECEKREQAMVKKYETMIYTLREEFAAKEDLIRSYERRLGTKE